MASPLLTGLQAYWSFDTSSWTDSTGNGYDLSDQGSGVTVGTGIIGGDANFTSATQYLNTSQSISTSGDFAIGIWVNPSSYDSNGGGLFGGGSGLPSGNQQIQLTSGGNVSIGVSQQGNFYTTNFSVPLNTWSYLVLNQVSGELKFYLNGTYQESGTYGYTLTLDIPTIGAFVNYAGYQFFGGIDETGIWYRSLTDGEITSLYNNGYGNAYPFAQSPTSPLYYNNAQSDGDWGNLLNWWQDAGFTTQATALPTTTNPVNLYNQVTQNTQGADQCFCSTASFWSADFGAGLTLQASGVVNMQGSSILAGTTADGVSMHDSSQIASTGVVTGNAVLRDSSRNYGTITGNATVYYDGGNGHLPIGGTVDGTTSYLDWGYIAPCPSVGGGSSTISRLLHLPWFINI